MNLLPELVPESALRIIHVYNGDTNTYDIYEQLKGMLITPMTMFQFGDVVRNIFPEMF